METRAKALPAIPAICVRVRKITVAVALVGATLVLPVALAQTLPDTLMRTGNEAFRVG